MNLFMRFCKYSNPKIKKSYLNFPPNATVDCTVILLFFKLMDISKTTFFTSFIEQGYTYAAYRDLLDQLMAEGKTTGPNQSDSMLHYAKLNLSRMQRLEKTFSPDAEIQQLAPSIAQEMIWIILTEGWCGDAAQSLPIIEKIAQLSPYIETRYLLRDENLPLMDQYLTDGGRSIPKLICLRKSDLAELGTWGPRPAVLQAQFKQMKAENLPYPEISEALHKWYAKDKGAAIQAEFAHLLTHWA
jgi:hypothetical protein